MTQHRTHDWASPEYVQSWAERTDRIEPQRRYRFDLMADLVPYAADAPIAILDLGAGYGALTAVLLERFSAARATCLDGSQAMLELLETRRSSMRGRITTIIADYGEPDWVNRLAGERFEVVVSSQALHGLRWGRRQLYQEIYNVLKPGGCFLNADLVPASTERLRERFRDVVIRRRITAREGAPGTRPTYEEVAAEVDIVRPTGSPTSHSGSFGLGDWTEDLSWLKEAGFVDVDCFWKELRLSVVGGYRE